VATDSEVQEDDRVGWAGGAVRGVCSGAATTAVAAGGTAEKENRERGAKMKWWNMWLLCVLLSVGLQWQLVCATTTL